MTLLSLFTQARAFLKHRPYPVLLMAATPGSSFAALPGAQAPTRGTGTSFLQT
ncbi:TIGR03745 family integrating conjugative element membrane protein, partial [Pseudomonas syringae pv. tomato]